MVQYISVTKFTVDLLMQRLSQQSLENSYDFSIEKSDVSGTRSRVVACDRYVSMSPEISPSMALLPVFGFISLLWVVNPLSNQSSQFFVISSD